MQNSIEKEGKQQSKIATAWCVDLQAEVSIREARLAYLNLENPPRKFFFYCNDKECELMQPRVGVTGANYRTLAEESDKYIREYFRLMPGQRHHPSCGWLVKRRITDDADIIYKESENQKRNSRRKETDFVTEYDPFEFKNDTKHTFKTAQKTSSAESKNEYRVKNEKSPSERSGVIKAKSMEDLVDSFLEIQSRFSRESLREIMLSVKRVGLVSYRDYFQKPNFTNGKGIIYGGIRQIIPYSFGFSLKFYDKYKGKPLSLYVSSEQLMEYENRVAVRKYIDAMKGNERNQTLIAYCHGTLEYSEKHDTWSLHVEDLNHLVLKIRPKEPLDSSML